jgi:hypothetical protein
VIEGFEEFMVHTVTVETHTGEDPFGNVNTVTSDPIAGFLDDSRALVRNASGDQVVSESTFYTGKEHRGVFAPESLVHLPDRVATVINVKTADSGPLGLPDHIAVVLT